jgi:EAL domain-containing protein (putative c-di-GMP-specific phosphodiesterase class I)
MQTIAEGIESSGQAGRLRTLACELGQGYYFSEPVSAAEASALLATSPNPQSQGDAS